MYVLVAIPRQQSSTTSSVPMQTHNLGQKNRLPSVLAASRFLHCQQEKLGLFLTVVSGYSNAHEFLFLFILILFVYLLFADHRDFSQWIVPPCRRPLPRRRQ